VEEDGEASLPGRKLGEICRALDTGCGVQVAVREGRGRIAGGRSVFQLGALPGGDFPVMDSVGGGVLLRVARGVLKEALQRTAFAMGDKDVRYYLNGMLWERWDGRLRAVATDGHRLAMCDVDVDGLEGKGEQVIVPRKGVIELERMLGGGDEFVELEIGTQGIRAQSGAVVVSSKLVDGRFPDYERVVPREARCDKCVRAERDRLRNGLARVGILANENHRAVRLQVEKGVLRVRAHNPEREEAEEELDVEYEGDPLEIGFNVGYLVDALGAVKDREVLMFLTDGNSSSVVRGAGEAGCRFVVMPMRL
jgi:DNA polymerase-3 subunit beta